MPSKTALRKAFDHNHDGCGFVSESLTYKSLDFEDFYKHLIQVPKRENCVIHFRWATQGSVCTRNCHPFYDKQSDTYFAHNGVLPFYPKEDITDSEYVFRKFLVGEIRKHGIMTHHLKDAVASVIGSSKFAIMKDGHVQLFGSFIGYGGCYYSNLRHLNVPYFRYAV